MNNVEAEKVVLSRAKVIGEFNILLEKTRHKNIMKELDLMGKHKIKQINRETIMPKKIVYVFVRDKIYLKKLKGEINEIRNEEKAAVKAIRKERNKSKEKSK